jgi:hypothetical protein
MLSIELHKLVTGEKMNVGPRPSSLSQCLAVRRGDCGRLQCRSVANPNQLFFGAQYGRRRIADLFRRDKEVGVAWAV